MWCQNYYEGGKMLFLDIDKLVSYRTLSFRSLHVFRKIPIILPSALPAHLKSNCFKNQSEFDASFRRGVGDDLFFKHCLLSWLHQGTMWLFIHTQYCRYCFTLGQSFINPSSECWLIPCVEEKKKKWAHTVFTHLFPDCISRLCPALVVASLGLFVSCSNSLALYLFVCLLVPPKKPAGRACWKYFLAHSRSARENCSPALSAGAKPSEREEKLWLLKVFTWAQLLPVNESGDLLHLILYCSLIVPCLTCCVEVWVNKSRSNRVYL